MLLAFLVLRCITLGFMAGISRFFPSSEHGLYKATIISWEGTTFSNDSNDIGEADPKPKQRTIHHDWRTILYPGSMPNNKNIIEYTRENKNSLVVTTPLKILVSWHYYSQYIYIYRKIKNINQQPEKGPVVFCRLSNGLNLR